MYINRDIETKLVQLGVNFEAIAIYGARQVGKTTTVLNTFTKNFNFVSLSDIDDLTEALANPKEFLRNHPWPLIIDEIQKAPILFTVIKDLIDKERFHCLKNNKKKRLMFIMTGSNQYEIQQGISESLAGRVAVINMYSMTQNEILNYKGSLFDPNYENLINKNFNQIKIKSSNEIFKEIFNGGMPEIIANKVNRNDYFKSYVNTYLEKDVKSVIASTKIIQFRNFLSYIALRTGQELNYQLFSRDLGIDVNTCKRWISILENSGIIFLLNPYFSNLSKRIIKSPKLYFLDTGLCAYLCKWPNFEMLENGVMAGAFFETYVISEIFKNLSNNGIDPNMYLYFYRDIDQKEIDLLYVSNNSITPIEIKKNNYPIKANKNFNVLDKYKLKINKGMIICNIDRIHSINENAFYFPVAYLGY